MILYYSGCVNNHQRNHNRTWGAANIKTAIVILAAGLSERMGVFKPLLPVGGDSAIMRVIRAAKTAGICDIIVVTGYMRQALENELREKAPCTILVHNAEYSEGMFSSARAGLRSLPSDIDGFFLLPSDCCAVSADSLIKLMRVFDENRGRYAVRPKFSGRRGHPPLIPYRFAEGLISYNGDNGIKGFLRGLPSGEVEMADSETLLDMDTPADYAALLDFLGMPGYPSPAQCYKLFEKYNTPLHIIEHGEQVARLASDMALRILESGVGLDIKLLEAACLLHDIKRAEPLHAAAGAALLLCEGYPKAAILVGAHMDLRCDAVTSISERELLFLSDKLCRRGKVTPLDETEIELRAKYADSPDALAAMEERMKTAHLIENMFEERWRQSSGFCGSGD